MRVKQVYLLLGSNIGDRFAHIENGMMAIRGNAGDIEMRSAFYETEPWGVTGQSDYLNAAVMIHTSLSPEVLFTRLKKIEGEEGRTSQQKYASRTLDIDILFYDGLVLNSRALVIPHPRLQLRRFALIPMKEIAPRLMHPVLKKTIAELLIDCKDEKEVHKVNR